MIRAYYDYQRPDIVHLDRRLRSGFGMFAKYDVMISCNLGWPGGKDEAPSCDKRAKHAKVDGRPICVYPDQKAGPVEDGAGVGWSGLGQCMAEFKYGLIRTSDQKKDATRIASDAAKWIDNFVEPNTGPSQEALRDNRRLVSAAKATTRKIR